LENNKKNLFDYAISEWADNQHGYSAYRLIRTRESKLIVWEDIKKKIEVYDLLKDPHELTNVAGQDDYKSIRQKLMNKLIQWMQETKDPALKWASFSKN